MWSRLFNRTRRTTWLDRSPASGKASGGARLSGLEPLESRHMLSGVTAIPPCVSYGAQAVKPAVVKAVVTGSVDLTVQFGSVSLPLSAISGSGAKFSIPILVYNQGTGLAPGGSVMAINLYARLTDAVDSSQDVLIGSIPSASVSGLQPGASKAFTPTITLPLYLATGTYNVVVVVNADNSITETNTSNDSAVTSGSIAVTAGTVDLQAGLVTAKLAGNATTGRNTSGYGKVVVTNGGNVPLPAKQNILVTLYARPVGALGDFSDILLTAEGESVNGLKPGHSVTLTVSITAIPTNVPEGQYSIVAFVDSTNIVAESNENNNIGVSTDIVTVSGKQGASGTSQAVDLAITGASTTLSAINADGAGGQATIDFTNAGINDATGAFTINIYAVSQNGVNQGATLVGSSGSQVLDLAAGTAGAPTTISITLPTPGSSANYELIAEIIPSAGDINAANNVWSIAPVTVTPVVPLLGFLPTTMVFTQTSPPVANGLTSTSSGTFTGGGESGTYTWVANTAGPSTNQGTLTVTLDGEPADHGSLTLTVAIGTVPASLDTDTLTFQTASAGVTGSFIGTVASLGGVAPTGFFILN